MHDALSDWLRALARPRLVGTAAERETADFIAKKFSEWGYAVDRHPFEFSRVPFTLLPRLGSALLAGATLAATLLWDASAPQPIDALMLFAPVIIAAGFSQWGRGTEDLYRIRRGGTFTSTNIIARTAKAPRVIVAAHYDSKSQTLSGAVRAALFLIVAALCIIAILLTGVSPWIAGCDVAGRISAYSAAAITLLLQFNRTGNASPGAYDNASGVVAMLAVARAAAEQKIDDVAFVATGAEELGLGGAVALLEHPILTENPGARILNIDSVGSTGAVRLFTRHGLFRDETAGEFLDVVTTACDRRDEPYRLMWLPTGAGIDHIPWGARGYETLTLSIGGFTPAVRAIHTRADTTDVVSIEGIARAVGIVMEVIA